MKDVVQIKGTAEENALQWIVLVFLLLSFKSFEMMILIFCFAYIDLEVYIDGPEF